MMIAFAPAIPSHAFSRASAMVRKDPAARGYLRVHLQWFAAEDEGRTEEPTEYRIKKAREEGRIAKSQELVGAVGLLLPFMTLVIAAPSMFGALADMIAHYFSLVSEADPLGQGRAISGAALGYFLRLASPIAAVAVVSALASNLLQTGFNFTLKPVTPDFSRIVPRFGQYFKRTLFSMEGLYNLAKSMVKIAIIVIIAWINISGEFAKLANLYSMALLDALEFVSGIAVRVVLEASLVLLAFSVVDILYQRWQYKEQLKMTKEEVKEERKMYEGDPLVKGRLREKMRELVSRNVAKAVPESTVVVTNPTHYAVALKWEEAAMSAPEVTAKGADDAALRIRRIAVDAGVPVVENRPLARALYAEAEIGDAIPEKYYEAIAGLIAHVYMMDEKEKARAAAAVAAEG
jgi:flagellar biosynthesis protein FlhB